MSVYRCLLFFFLLLGVASAHVRDLIVTEYQIEERRVQMTMVIPFKALQGFDDDKDGALSTTETIAHQELILESLNQRIQLTDGSQQARLSLGQLPPGYQVPDLGAMPGSHGAIPLLFTFDQPIQNLAVHYDYFPFPERCVATFHRGQEVKTFTFSPGQSDFRMGSEPGKFAGFFWMGVNHLFSGPDHLLFLLALLCCAPGLTATIKTVTAFTVAHSVTLTLGGLGWIQVPSRLIEPLIAASILYTALANLLVDKNKPVNAWKIAFVFGLVHGLGFASVLNEIQLSGMAWFGALAGFNVGIEFAQIALVLFALPILWRIGQIDERGYALRLVSLVTCLIAAYWFWERVKLYWL